MTKQFKLTVKGQVTIPKDVRDLLDLKPGEPVVFEREGDKVVVRKGAVAAADRQTGYDDMIERIRKARALFPPLPLGMPTDDYMAMIREPVPLSDGDDDLR